MNAPTKPRNLAVSEWWRVFNGPTPPEYYIPVNTGARYKIVRGKPDPHGVWLVLNNRVALRGNSISNRVKLIRGTPKTMFQLWQNKQFNVARAMMGNVTGLNMNKRIAAKRMVQEILKSRRIAMNNANWKVRAGIKGLNANSIEKHQRTINFWNWVGRQINTGGRANAPLNKSPVRAVSRGRSTVGRAVPNAWNA